MRTMTSVTTPGTIATSTWCCDKPHKTRVNKTRKDVVDVSEMADEDESSTLESIGISGT